MTRIRSWKDLKLWLRVYGRDLWLLAISIGVVFTLAAYGCQQRTTARQAHDNCIARMEGVPIFAKVLRATNAASEKRIRQYEAARPTHCD